MSKEIDAMVIDTKQGQIKQIFGNCLICHTEPSEEGRIKTSLSDKDIQEVKDNIDFYITKKTIGNKSEIISTPVVVVDKVY